MSNSPVVPSCETVYLCKVGFMLHNKLIPDWVWIPHDSIKAEFGEYAKLEACLPDGISYECYCKLSTAEEFLGENKWLNEIVFKDPRTRISDWDSFRFFPRDQIGVEALAVVMDTVAWPCVSWRSPLLERVTLCETAESEQEWSDMFDEITRLCRSEEWSFANSEYPDWILRICSRDRDDLLRVKAALHGT